jgi:hypothetical protein
MAKNGNGEGSIYEHKKNGKKVGYRGRIGYTRQKARSVATCLARHAKRYATS